MWYVQWTQGNISRKASEAHEQEMHIHTHAWIVHSIYTPGCKSPPFHTILLLSLACAALRIDASVWYAFLNSVKLRCRDAINQVCLCMRARLSSSGYGNKLDCVPARETEPLNGAKDGRLSSSLILPLSLLTPRFILPSRLARYEEKVHIF